MFDKARSMLYTGVGLMMLTRDKAEKMVQEWVKEGELSQEEGRRLMENWSQKIDAEKEELQGRIQKEVERVIETAGLASRKELQALTERIAVLEAQVERLEESMPPGAEEQNESE